MPLRSEVTIRTENNITTESSDIVTNMPEGGIESLFLANNLETLTGLFFLWLFGEVGFLP